ncbi:MAG: BRCT domain-containing protein [Limisphaerales bacterium]
MHADIGELSKSTIISDYLRLRDLVEEAKQVNPDATKGDGKFPIKAERTQTEEEQRIKQHAELNAQIRAIESRLKNAGVKLEVKGKPKKNGKPPLLDVASELESEACLSIQRFFASEYGKRTVLQMAKLDIKPTSQIKKVSASVSPIAGMTFVLTGTLPTLSRDEASEMIREAGGNVTGSISTKNGFSTRWRRSGFKIG